MTASLLTLGDILHKGRESAVFGFRAGSEERALCSIVENYQEQDGVRARTLGPCASIPCTHDLAVES